ncbi:hypothetical protein LA354_07405 [Ralstonia pickettii]|uniref:hypothetical protein n=1 Tax=Ralstonia pickettii TaxID=329 RepID=UPI001184E7A0|nr:hypothetical protein [Ralstonia pickettii]UCA15810.1 hypothetical protein LA354_07405 [Ralstonia pickettii]
MNDKTNIEGDAATFVERLLRDRKRHLLAIKLSAPDRSTLEWELASARALIGEYRSQLSEAMRQRGEFDRMNNILVEALSNAPDIIRSNDAKQRASARHSNSVQAEHKRIAREWFDRWCAQPETHATKEEFVECFLDVNPDSVSARALREWLTMWSKEKGVAPWRRS